MQTHGLTTHNTLYTWKLHKSTNQTYGIPARIFTWTQFALQNILVEYP